MSRFPDASTSKGYTVKHFPVTLEVVPNYKATIEEAMSKFEKTTKRRV